LLGGGVSVKLVIQVSPTIRLRPLIVVLGGVRVQPTESLHRRVERTRTVRRKLVDREGRSVPVAQKRAEHRETLLYPAEWKAANRFRKNTYAILRELTFSSPLGRIALAASAPKLSELRERALAEAVIHNRECPHWHVLVEGPTWATLPEDAESVLLTVLGGRLPAWMFVSSPS
jgi:hypothetical protein